MNLIKGIQKECERCINLKTVYDEIPTGKFGAYCIQDAIDEGRASIVSGEVVRMLSAFKELESCK